VPIKKERCESCGEREDACPNCGGKHVTPLDNPQTPKPTEIAIYGGESEVEYKNICWDCGWREEVVVTFERSS